MISPMNAFASHEIETPCVKVCVVDPDTGFCIGCEAYKVLARVRGVEVCEDCAPSRSQSVVQS